MLYLFKTRYFGKLENASLLSHLLKVVVLPFSGLPGKFSFSLCFILPIVCAMHAGWICIYLAKRMSTQLFTWFSRDRNNSLRIILRNDRLFYLHRFLNQNDLPTSVFASVVLHQRKRGSHKCIRALFTITTDYTCFKSFCSICFWYCLQASVLAITSNVAGQYT